MNYLKKRLTLISFILLMAITTIASHGTVVKTGDQRKRQAASKEVNEDITRVTNREVSVRSSTSVKSTMGEQNDERPAFQTSTSQTNYKAAGSNDYGAVNGSDTTTSESVHGSTALRTNGVVRASSFTFSETHMRIVSGGDDGTYIARDGDPYSPSPRPPAIETSYPYDLEVWWFDYRESSGGYHHGWDVSCLMLYYQIDDGGLEYLQCDSSIVHPWKDILDGEDGYRFHVGAYLGSSSNYNIKEWTVGKTIKFRVNFNSVLEFSFYVPETASYGPEVTWKNPPPAPDTPSTAGNFVFTPSPTHNFGPWDPDEYVSGSCYFEIENGIYTKEFDPDLGWSWYWVPSIYWNDDSNWQNDYNAHGNAYIASGSGIWGMGYTSRVIDTLNRQYYFYVTVTYENLKDVGGGEWGFKIVNGHGNNYVKKGGDVQLSQRPACIINHIEDDYGNVGYGEETSETMKGTMTVDIEISQDPLSGSLTQYILDWSPDGDFPSGSVTEILNYVGSTTGITAAVDWDTDLPGEGIFYIRLRAWNDNSQMDETKVSVSIDNVDPTLSIFSIDADLTDSTTVPVTVTATDLTAMEMRFSAKTSPDPSVDADWGSWVAHASSYSLALEGLPGWSGSQGSNTITVMVKDSVENYATKSDTFNYDTEAPDITVFTIDVDWTDSTTVPVTVTAADMSAMQMRFSAKTSPDPSIDADWGSWVAHASSYSLTLDGLPGWSGSQGSNTITVVVKDALDKKTTKSDTFNYDSEAPDVTVFTIDVDWTDSTTVPVTVTAADTSVMQMRFSAETSPDPSIDADWGSWVAHASSYSLALDGLPGWSGSQGSSTITVMVKDTFDKKTTKSDTFNYDSEVPDITVFTIDVDWTDSTTVPVTVTATDLTAMQMRFSAETSPDPSIDADWGSWVAYTSSYSLTLDGLPGWSGSQGSSTITVMVKDAFDKKTTKSDTFNYDSEAPDITVFTIDVDWTDSTTVPVTVTAADTSAMQMRFSAKTSPDPSIDADWGSWVAYTSSYSLTLDGLPGWSGSQGSNTITVVVKDAFDKKTTKYDTFTYDTGAPIDGSIVITDSTTGNEEGTVATTVTLTLYATDVVSGVSQMRFKTGTGSWSDLEDYATSFTYILDASVEGTITATVEFIDRAGNSVQCSDTIIYDFHAPDCLTIDCNMYTASQSVSLTLSATDYDEGGAGTYSGVWQMRFRNEDDQWSDWEDYATSRAWTLPVTDGTNFVYFQVRDFAGNVAMAQYAEVNLDTQSPSLSSVDVLDFTSSTTITIANIQAEDVLKNGYDSGVTQICFSNDGALEEWSDWESYTTSMDKSWSLTSYGGDCASDGTKYFFIRIRDRAGNEQISSQLSVTLDRGYPTNNSITIDGGAKYTSVTAVTLMLTVTDASPVEMRFSNDESIWSDWESFSSSKTWYITTGQGSKEVHYQVRDAAGNQPNTISDSIILDFQKPTDLSIIANDGDIYAGSQGITLTLTANDLNPTSLEMRFKNSGGLWSGWEEFSTTKAWDLATGDGNKSIFYEVRDGAGNQADMVEMWIILDTVNPSDLSIITNTGAIYTNSPTVELTLAATDVNPTSLEMSFSNDGTSWSSWELFGTSKMWTLSTGDEYKTIFYRVRDGAGNQAPAVSDGITLDLTTPSGVSIDANDGDIYTPITEVTLTLTASDPYAMETRFKNDGESWTEWETFSTTKSWILTSGDGEKTIFFEVRDAAGNVVQTSDVIIYDSGPPTVDITINDEDEYTATTSVTLILSSPDADPSEMCFSHDNISWSDWESYAATKEWSLIPSDGNHTTYAKIRDTAGNTICISDNISLDSIDPNNLVILVNDGAAYTDNPAVVLTLSASDSSPLEIRFSNDGLTWTDWEAYTDTKDWSLHSGEGERNAYFQARDAAGNQPLAIYTSIIVDTTFPSDESVLVNDGDEYTNSETVVMTLSGSDANPLEMRFSKDNGMTWSAWGSFITTTSFELDSEDKEHTIIMQLRDGAGHLVECSDSIIFDSTTPGSPTIVCNGGDTYTTSTTITLSLTATDASPLEMRFSNDGITWSGWEDFSVIKLWDIEVSNGNKTISYSIRDIAGNQADAVEMWIILDNEYPTDLIVNIDSGNEATNDREVSLFVDATDITSMQMRFSNDNTTWSGWLPLTTTQLWTLTNIDEIKTVYLQVKDAVGHVATACDIITLDREAPTNVTIEINDGVEYTQDRTVDLTLTCPDAVLMRIGVEINGEIQWGNNQSFVENCQFTLSNDDGLYTIHLEVTDLAGNVATSVIDEIVLDRVASVIDLFLLDSGAESTANRQVTATLLITEDSTPLEEVMVRFSNDGINWDAWIPYTSSYLWNLTEGDSIKSVRVQVKDGASHVTSEIDTITLSENAPVIQTCEVNEGGNYTADRQVTITFSVENATEMCFSNDGFTWSDWETYSGSKNYVLPDQDGEITVHAQFRTVENGPTSQVGRNIILDRVAATIANVLVINPDQVYSDGENVSILVEASEAGLTMIVDFSSLDSGYNAEEVNVTDLGNTQYLIEYTINILNSVPDGEYKVVILVRDAAGNENYDESLRLELDNSVPTGVTVSINCDAEYTGVTEVELSLTAYDEHGMLVRFSNDGENWTEWELFETTMQWQVTDGIGIKTVFVEVSDVTGNVARVKSDTIEFSYIVYLYAIDCPVHHDHNEELTISVNATDFVITETNMEVTLYLSKNGIFFDYDLHLKYNLLSEMWYGVVNESYYEYGDMLYFYINVSNVLSNVMDTNNGKLYTINIVDQSAPAYEWINYLNTTAELGENYYFSLTADDLEGSGVDIDNVTLYYSHDGALWDTKHMRWNADKRSFEVTLQGSAFVSLDLETRIQYYVEIIDQDGNVAKTTLRTFDLIDTKAPTIVLPEFPANDADGEFTITFDVADPSGITSIVVWQKYDNGTWQVANITSDGDSCSISCEFKNEITDYQKLYFFIEATDAEGNVGYLGKNGLEEEYTYACGAPFKVTNDGYDPNPNTNTDNSENDKNPQNNGNTVDDPGFDAGGLVVIVGILGIVVLIGVTFFKGSGGQPSGSENPLGENAKVTDGAPSDTPVTTETTGFNTETDATDLVFGDDGP